MEDSLREALMHVQLSQLLIPAKNVACVLRYNNLEHALLILTKAGYTAVPVLDDHGSVCGTISKTNILDAMLSTDKIDVDKLHEVLVEQAMTTKIPRLTTSDSFLKGMELLINNPFVCVLDAEEHFHGILTRRAVLIEIERKLRRRD
ncbi:cyclic-di-AMP-binding protein CbpB [Alicyclobacillus cycloheptanicus]|uniref:Transcriptional regulator n=1 Tax=Alicyclobacillus cycloheptanicus TaxID=1457 RepID=A0ABT9XLJ6_9BACL|nr:cyclic-di-AMP-binding protein CbpB [Alicyclobacillus cycloheptanicus]MDQ0191185.1 putative transcriptional regulator [Alicyclobacillus cycloheptanicus]